MENKKFFGTDGIRGVAGEAPLDPESLVRLGKSIASVLNVRDQHKRKHPQVLIGKDTRLSGYMIETSLSAGLTSMGADVMLVGPVPTPGVSYLTWSMRADAGIVISASHNSYEDNGIKIFGPHGQKFPNALEEKLEELFVPGGLDGQHAVPGEIGKAKRIDDAIGRYTVYLKSCFPSDQTLEGLQIGVDCANGAAYVVAPQTFEELGAEVFTRGSSPNGKNINAGFGSLYPEVASNLVTENNLDIGVSLDGDADRAIFTDHKGQIIDGDVVLAICALDLKQRGLLRKPTVVATVMSNLGLEKLLQRNGIEVKRVNVGDKNVLEELKKSDLQLGGEQSGHTIFLDHAFTGDGTLTALMLMSVMVRTGKSLNELAADFEHFPQKLVNVKVASKPEMNSIEPLARLIEEKERLLKDTGRILVRYSGTENKARVMVECEDEDSCLKHANDVAEVIERELG